MAIGRVIGEAFVAIKPDSSAFGTELKRDAQKAIDDLKRQIDTGVGGAIDGADKKASGLGGTFKTLAATAVAAFGAVQIGGFLKEGIDQAADLGESINAMTLTLGDGAASFIEFGKTAADTLGITQAALNEALVPLASMLRNAGLSGEALSKELQAVATRATDVASVFNKDVNEVLNAFGAAIRGETEPIRAYGVQLDQAAISAKAVELGLAATAEEVSNAAKTQAALALVMEQTNRAAGDFANTSNSLPNLMKRFTATLEETKGALGQGLLPVISQVLQSILPAVTALVPVFTNIGQALVPVVAGIGEAISRLAPVITNVLAQIGPAFAPLAELFPALAETIAPIIGTIGNLISTLLPPILTVVRALVVVIDPFISFFATIVNVLLDAFGPALQDIADIISDLADVFVDAFGALRSDGGLEAVFESIRETLTALAPVLTQTAQILAGVLAGAFKAIAPVLAQIVTLVAQFIERALTDLAPFLPKLAQLFGRLIESLLPLLPILLDLVTIFLDAMAPVLPQLADSFVLIVEALLPLIPPFVKLIEIISPLAPILLGLALIIGGPGTVGGFILGLIGISAILQQLLPVLGQVASAIGGFFVRAFETAVGAVQWFLRFYFELPMTIFRTAVNIGESLINGIVRGVQNLLGYIADVGRAIGNTLIDAFNVVVRLINDFLPDEVGIGPVKLNLPDNPLPKIPRLAEGGFSFGEGLSYLDPNEAIVPTNNERGIRMLADAMALAAQSRPDLSGGDGVIFQDGAIRVTFEGVTPSEQEAAMVGSTLAASFAERFVRERKVKLEARRISGR